MVIGTRLDETLDLEEEAKLKDPVRCFYCGIEGEYGEIVEEDYRDSTGRDSFVLACKNTKACQDRQYGRKEATVKTFRCKECLSKVDLPDYTNPYPICPVCDGELEPVNEKELVKES